MHGPGKSTRYDESTRRSKRVVFQYVGGFLKGMMHGFGRYESVACDYIGAMRDNVEHGRGIRYFHQPIDRVFVGLMVNGQISVGVLEDGNGTRLVAPYGFDEHVNPIREAMFCFDQSDNMSSINRSNNQPNITAYCGEIYTFSVTSPDRSKAGLPHGFGEVTWRDGRNHPSIVKKG